jgi:guanine deaminase
LNDASFMRRAIALSRAMPEQGAGPFGAVIVKDGSIIGEGFNRVVTSNDPTAHAEIVAIRAACSALDGGSVLVGEIYTSCEPCPMCLAAIYWARLERIYYGNDRGDAARIGFDDDAIYGEIALPLDARRIPMTRLLADEARHAFDAWQRKPDKIPY